MTEPVRTCATCKHWKRVVPTQPWGYGTGIPLGSGSFENEPPRSEHGHCGRIPQVNKLKYPQVPSEPAISCDTDYYCSWLCTLPTFGCILHEPKKETSP